MRSSRFSPYGLAASILSVLPVASAIRLIESNSLNSCQDNSSFTASLFNVIFTPNNLTLTFDVVGVSSIQGNVTFGIDVSAYGYSVVNQVLDPCDSSLDLSGMCPMSTGQIDISSNIALTQDVVNKIPGIAYAVPDLDATVKVIINSTAGVQLACVEANLSNGQTVDQKGVGWATAIIAGLALAASAVTSGLGHSNTAAHVAANALSLFGYFQAQAIVGLTAIHLPPIVQSWTANFNWTMGIIEVRFLQKIAQWYQQATGGTPATLLNTLTTTSVEVLKRRKRSLARRVAKRGVETTVRVLERGLDRAHAILRRSNSGTVTGTYVVRGIKRVAFRSDIESTNLFMTGLIFFCVFVVFTIIGVAIFKGFCELLVKSRKMKDDKFLDFRNGWLTVLKGIMFRLVLIGFPQMVILCLWELTQVDSPAEVVLAIFFFFGMTFTLGWATWKVIRIAKRSVHLHKNPAYILYSDPAALNKWGFLYVQFRATAYYFILPTLLYTLVKGMFIAFGQGSGTVQGIALVLIEAAALIGSSIIRPWMDKSTNSFNIGIAAINFLNAVFLLVFTDIFGQPDIVTGVMGVIFFIMNAAFSLVLLILVLIATIYAFARKNPDTRYQPMTDDRASFIKSQTQLTTELDALGATARGDKAGYKHNLDLDEESDSWSGSDFIRNPANMALPPSTANSGYSRDHPPHSPMDPSMPLFPAETRHNTPPKYSDSPAAFGDFGDRGSGNASPAPAYNMPQAAQSSVPLRAANNNSPAFRAQHNASPWQRGAGYDH